MSKPQLERLHGWDNKIQALVIYEDLKLNALRESLATVAQGSRFHLIDSDAWNGGNILDTQPRDEANNFALFITPPREPRPVKCEALNLSKKVMRYKLLQRKWIHPSNSIP